MFDVCIISSDIDAENFLKGISLANRTEVLFFSFCFMKDWRTLQQPKKKSLSFEGVPKREKPEKAPTAQPLHWNRLLYFFLFTQNDFSFFEEKNQIDTEKVEFAFSLEYHFFFFLHHFCSFYLASLFYVLCRMFQLLWSVWSTPLQKNYRNPQRRKRECTVLSDLNLL